MTRVGVLGLGAMGAPVAHNLVKAGFATTVWNRTPAATEPFRTAGVPVASTPGELNADVVLSILPDVEQLEALLPRALPAWREAGTALLVVMSTTSPAKAVALGDRLQPVGISVADAPMSGGDRGAREGTLSLMVGADDQSWSTLSPILEALASTVIRFGGLGAGSVAKLCNQIVVAGTLTALAEALALAERTGIDRGELVRAFEHGLAASRVLELKREKLLELDFSVGGSALNQLKDLRYAVQLGQSAHAPVPLATLTRDLFEQIERAGLAAEDHSVILELYRSMPDRVAAHVDEPLQDGRP